jgi:aminopeptidase N
VVKSTEESTRGIRESVSGQARAVDVSALKSLPQVMERVSGKKIIYVGEFHDRFSNHVMQLEMIKDLLGKGKKIAIGMEMFQKPFQKVLDDYIEGRIDEPAFLKGTEYFKRWRFDYNLYRPILLFARAEKIPVVALNQRQEIVEKVARTGLESLSPEEKKAIPVSMDFSDDRYREALTKVFHQHEAMQADKFDFFYQAQVLWDETMAQSVDEFLRVHPQDQMAVLAGNGHLAHGSGIPKRVARRNGYDYAIVLNDMDPEPGIADFLLFPGTIPAVSAPVLMVMLKDQAGRVEITGFPPKSISEKAGMRAGDVIAAIDKAPVHSIEDIKIDLLSRKKGDKVTVRVLRKSVLGSREMEFEVTLQ